VKHLSLPVLLALPLLIVATGCGDSKPPPPTNTTGVGTTKFIAKEKQSRIGEVDMIDPHIKKSR